MNSSHITYIPAILKVSASWYIEFYYYDSEGRHRVRKYINNAIRRFRSKKEKRFYAQGQVDIINRKLASGWTPAHDKAIETGTRLAATPWATVVAHYRDSIEKMLQDDFLRKATKNSYNSYVNILDSWNQKHNVRQIKFIYEFDEEQCRSFLDWLLQIRRVSFSTRDYYRLWLLTFCQWLLDSGYLKTSPMVNVSPIVSRKKQKEKARREVKNYYIPCDVRDRIFTYLSSHNKHFLLSCYLLYFCFVRPKEQVGLKISYIHLHDQQLFIPADLSKNRKDDLVTLPTVVIELMLDLNLFDNPSEAFIFGRGLEPSLHKTTAEALRDAWISIRKPLSLPTTMKMYHLKHSGITDMIETDIPKSAVQQQARHQSIVITELYQQSVEKTANNEIKKWKGK